MCGKFTGSWTQKNLIGIAYSNWISLGLLLDPIAFNDLAPDLSDELKCASDKSADCESPNQSPVDILESSAAIQKAMQAGGIS